MSPKSLGPLIIVTVATVIAVAACTPRVSGEIVTPSPPASPISNEQDQSPAQPLPAETPPAAHTPVPPHASTPAPTEHPGSQCLLPEPLVKQANNRPLAQASVGDKVTLDAQTIFAPHDDMLDQVWSQVFAGQDSLDYTTHTRVDLSGKFTSVVSFTATTPGKYRFRLVATNASGVESAHEVEVLVRGLEERFEFRSINFPDLFGNNGGDAYDVSPDDPECLEQVFEHAFAMAPRINANWVTIVPAQFLTQVDPTPRWGATYEDLSLTDDDYYAALIEAAHARGLKVLQAEQDAPDFSLADLDYERWAEVRRSPEYWEAWFDEWTPWAVERAARAEKHGVDMFSPFVWVNDLLRPEKHPDYERRWLEMISAIREVYSGQIALWSIGSMDENLTFTDKIDAVIISLDSNGLFGEGLIGNRYEPTLEQVIGSVKGRISQTRPAFAESGVPVYYAPIASSSDGQFGSEDVEELATFVPDFQKQGIYYEGMIQAFADEPWITGVMLSVTDWFDQFGRPPEGLYFDQTFQVSPRSKPAEDLSAIWFGAE